MNPSCIFTELSQKILSGPGKFAKSSVFLPTQADLDLAALEEKNKLVQILLDPREGEKKQVKFQLPKGHQENVNTEIKPDQDITTGGSETNTPLSKITTP